MTAERVLFVPVSGPSGSGELQRALILADALRRRRPEAAIQFAVSRHARGAETVPHPTLLLDATVIKDKEGTSDVYYFVTPDMRGHPKLTPRLRPVTITLTCMWPGNGFLLWPVPQKTDFKPWKSEKAAAEQAQTLWTNLVWDEEKGDYDVGTAEDLKMVLPTWPKESFEQLLKIGFADLIVDNEDHYYVRRLRGIID